MNNVMTNEMVLSRLKEHYEKKYKLLFNTYFVNLDFTTILVYYSGTCSVVIEITSIPGFSVNTTMLFMVDANKNELFQLDEETIDNVIKKGILEKYQHFFSINQSLCNYGFSRKIILRNANFREPILSIKLEKEVIVLEMNSNCMNEIDKNDYDFAYVLDSVSKHFSYN